MLGDRPPERLFAEFAARFATCDVNGLLDLYADDYVLVDHRTFAWAESSSAAAGALSVTAHRSGSGPSSSDASPRATSTDCSTSTPRTTRGSITAR
jgi:ketosteroid isomerase-like protein